MNIFIENLKKEYDGKVILNIDEAHIESGSLCAIVGTNGSGKTTLVNIIAGLLKQSEGDVYYGKKPKNIPPSEIMTLVFQKPYLLRTSVEKNIAYPLKIRGWNEAEIEARTEKLLGDLGLLELRKEKAWKLSGGETQKVALARALSFKPKLLLLDEPTANIDPATTYEIERMLKKINEEESTTIFLVTHDIGQAKRICKTGIFMHQGGIVEQGKASEIFNTPEDDLTRKFISGELLL